MAPIGVDNEQRWINYIREYCFSEDIESNNKEAEKALKLFLISLGHEKIVEEYEKALRKNEAL